MANGGRRPGAGRKRGSRTAVQKAAIDVATAVLSEVKAKEVWKALVTSSDEKIKLEAMKYLTDRAHGKPTQKLEGDPNAPLFAQLVLVDAGSEH